MIEEIDLLFESDFGQKAMTTPTSPPPAFRPI
jgi:hypothetical protein